MVGITIEYVCMVQLGGVFLYAKASDRNNNGRLLHYSIGRSAFLHNSIWEEYQCIKFEMLFRAKRLIPYNYMVGITIGNNCTVQ